jgi:hypothetical protein
MRLVSLALVVQALLGGGVYALKKDNARSSRHVIEEGYHDRNA